MHFSLLTTSAKSAADVTKFYLWTGALILLQLGRTGWHEVGRQVVAVAVHPVPAPPVPQPVEKGQDPAKTKTIYKFFFIEQASAQWAHN